MKTRYSLDQIIKTSTGKQYFQSTIYPKIVEKSDDIYIQVNEAQRLDLLANKFYGNYTYWWIIACANNLPKDSVFVKENTQLRMPNPKRISDIFSELETINTSS